MLSCISKFHCCFFLRGDLFLSILFLVGKFVGTGSYWAKHRGRSLEHPWREWAGWALQVPGEPTYFRKVLSTCSKEVVPDARSLHWAMEAVPLTQPTLEETNHRLQASKQACACHPPIKGRELVPDLQNQGQASLRSHLWIWSDFEKKPHLYTRLNS